MDNRVGLALLSIVLGVLGALSACTEDTSIFDPFPIPVDVDGGVIILGARSTDLDSTGAVHRAVLDTGSAFTIFDNGASSTTRGRATVQVLAARTDVPRAQFDAVNALLSPTGQVGDGTPSAITAILGADLLILHALHIDIADRLLRITPDVAGDDTSLADSCEASFNTPLAGGGLYELGKDSVSYPATRVVWSVCLAPPFDCDVLVGGCAGGADTLLLVSTAVRPMVVSRSTFMRMPGVTEATIDALPTTTLYFPGNLRPGGVTAHATTVEGIAIADRGNHGDDNPARGACLEFRASRIMDPSNGLGQCSPAQIIDSNNSLPQDCPCQNATPACAVGPSIESRRTLDVVILEDTDPLLQSLRDELRPNFGDLSGFIGVEALRSFIVDIDYPNGRTVATCSPSDPTCVLRPEVTGSGSGDVTSRALELQTSGCFAPSTSLR